MPFKVKASICFKSKKTFEFSDEDVQGMSDKEIRELIDEAVQEWVKSEVYYHYEWIKLAKEKPKKPKNPFPKPRYDDVYFEGVKWLDEL